MKYPVAIWLAALSASAFAQAVPPPAPAPAQAAPPPCADPEYHRFDFWVGAWDVYNARGLLVAHSLIEAVYGCGIRENWMPVGRPGGGSLSIYVPASHGWEQFWIDAGGTRVLFRGGWNGSAMVISGAWARSPDTNQGPLVRMTYSRLEDGSVGQLGERSRDNGQTWAPSFNFTYRRHVS